MIPAPSPTSSLALAFVTIERPQVAQRLIRSARERFPDMAIYVADQSRRTEAMEHFYRANRVTAIRMPYDIGVTASRNALARTVKEPYFVLCDDDFVFGARTDFRDALRILEARPELAVIGGRLYDFDGNNEWLRNWELFLEYDPRQKILITIPIYELAPKAREIGGIRYYLCDTVLNFAVMRRSAFDAGVGWDERFKSNGEHEDFYLNIKLNTKFQVAYLPTLIAYHHHPEEYRTYRRRLRYRHDGWARFLEKWGLEQHLEVGLGVRTVDDVTSVAASSETRARFFVNADLSAQRAHAVPDALLIGNSGEISTVGGLDEAGNRIATRQSAALLLDAVSGRLLPATAGDGDSTSAADRPDDDDAVARYRVTASWRETAISVATRQLFFRYDALLRTDADFFLWYLCGDVLARADASQRRLAVVARWVASDGSILVWQSRRSYLELDSTSCWRPVHLEVPVVPRGCTWLRFELVTDGGPSPQPICTGFLFSCQGAAGRTAMDAAGLDVLGLGRIPHDGADPSRPGNLLDEIGRQAPQLPLALDRVVLARDLGLLRLDGCIGLEVLFFVGWDFLRRSLVSALLPPRTEGVPQVMALPWPHRGSQAGRIYGFGRQAGFVQIPIEETPSLVHQ